MKYESLFDQDDRAYESGDFRKAFDIFMLTATQVDADAMSRIACMFYAGEGVLRDFDSSVIWEKRAAEAGSVHALTNLGIGYCAYGMFSEAKLWFEKAIEAGDYEAALELAKLNLLAACRT